MLHLNRKLGSIDHIGIAVPDLDAAKRIFCDILGIPCIDEKNLPERAVRISFLSTGNTTIELLQGIGENSPISKFVEERGGGIHHICFEVENIEETLRELSCNGMRLVDEHARPGAEGKLVSFIHPKSTSGVLIELIQK